MANQNLFNALHELGFIALEGDMEAILRAVESDCKVKEGQFYVMCAKGNKPPKYKHNNLESAIIEAQRLSEINECNCEVLEIVAAVVREEVEVVRKEVRRQVVMVGGGAPNIEPKKQSKAAEIPMAISGNFIDDDLPF